MKISDIWSFLRKPTTPPPVLVEQKFTYQLTIYPEYKWVECQIKIGDYLESVGNYDWQFTERYPVSIKSTLDGGGILTRATVNNMFAVKLNNENHFKMLQLLMSEWI